MFEPLLNIAAVRRKLAFELRRGHFEALEIAAPIGQGLKCPILHPDYWHSFEEIFFGGEYGPVFEKIAPPGRWLDLGCHAGFFSLLVVAERRRRGLDENFSALLVDADSRVGPSVARICEVNGLNFQFLQRAIGSGSEVGFEEREVMASAVGMGKAVKVATAEELGGPYDLVKVDIEGAEFDLIRNYASLLRQARHLLIEWHSWAGPEIREVNGFRFAAEIVAAREVGEGLRCGVKLFARDGN